MNRLAFLTGLSALAAASMLMSGCGGSGNAEPRGGAATSPAPVDNGVAALPADAILAQATATLRKAGSYRIVGTNLMMKDDEKTTLDIRVSGDDFAGKLADGNAEVEVLAVDGKYYVKPNQAFFARAANAEDAEITAKVFNGRWLSTPASEMSSLFSVATFDKLLAAQGDLTKGETAQVDGGPTIILSDTVVKGLTVSETQLFVATTGEPYPMKFIAYLSGRGMTISEHGATFPEIALPAADQIIDISGLDK